MHKRILAIVLSSIILNTAFSQDKPFFQTVKNNNGPALGYSPSSGVKY
ncbi:MAG: hypothetical protein QM664_12930 [Flavihumibacter sp.]